MNIVSKENYWTTILNDLTQHGQITTEDGKFNEIAEYVWRVLQNTLILTEDEKQIKHWEEIVNVSGEGLTNFQRKVNILFLLSEKSYIPMSLLRKALDRLLGEGKYDLVVDDESDKIYLGFANYSSKEKAEFLLSKTVPSYYESEVEADRLPSNYFAVEFFEKSTLDTTPVYFSFNWGENKGAKITAIPYNNESTTTLIGTSWSENGFLRIPYGNYSCTYYGSNYNGFYFTNQKNIIEINFKNDGKLRTTTPENIFETELTPSKPIWGGQVESGLNLLAKIYNIQFSENSKIVSLYKPALRNDGVPVFYDIAQNTELPYKCDVIGLTHEQAIQLDKLPIGAGSLTFSLPWEAQLVQHNAEVEAALQEAKSNGWTITVQYRDPEPDNVVYNKYAECVTHDDVNAVNPDYKKDLTSDGAWIYPMPKLKSESFLFKSVTALTKFCVDLPSLTASNGLLQFTSITEFDRKFPLLKKWWGTFEGSSKLVRFLSDISHVEDGGYAFQSCSSLEVFESDLPKLSNGIGMFNATRLNKKSSLRILNSIPAWTSGSHPLKIGIHVDHQNDEEVIAAIENAEVKGWTLTVQWNGTATTQMTSTFGMRKPPIYAKIANRERPDGTTERFLDWGHYVTNAEENGYQEFSSIEEANEHFNIESETEQ